ncbi:MAG: DUF6155 family protein [Firmicutes bacterium]|nr:DUF6155 family protein [Bacillota bacterium]MCM1401377.1 DUF6155 family protein [Bacteroides sp.]MCM1477402.1 DUF6155 family protein [Bacteroides sp.]
MSKSQLKKLLGQMSASQIAEMVLELYDARPEAKEYLDFFVSPDIDRKLLKATAAIKKEAFRNSRGRNKSRSTKIRRYIRDIASLNPGSEPVAEIMTCAVETICAAGSDQIIKPSTQSGYARLLADTIQFIDAAGLITQYLPRIETAIDGMHLSWWRGNEFKKLLSQRLKDSLEAL